MDNRTFVQLVSWSLVLVTDFFRSVEQVKSFVVMVNVCS